MWFSLSMIFLLEIFGGCIDFFVGPCLVDSFGGTSLAWDSMGLESHRLDAKGPYVWIMMTYLWMPRRHLGGPILALTCQMNFLGGKNVTL
jgi:hypothetical protein